MDDKGFLSIIDATIAIVLVITVLLIFSSLLSVSLETYSASSRDSKNSQDIMNSIDTKINYTDTSFLEEITRILEENDNSEKSVKTVSKMIESKIHLNKFVFKETKQLNKVLFSTGDYTSSDNFTVASRDCGNYSYTLIVYD